MSDVLIRDVPDALPAIDARAGWLAGWLGLSRVEYLYWGAVAFADRWAGRCSWRPVSDRPGELGERRGDSKLTRGFGGEFVVAAAEVLDEGESGDDDLSGLFCA